MENKHQNHSQEPTNLVTMATGPPLSMLRRHAEPLKQSGKKRREPAPSPEPVKSEERHGIIYDFFCILLWQYSRCFQCAAAPSNEIGKRI